MVSDMALALQVFKVMPEMQHGNAIVMVTYYLAQLLIAVGDVKAEENKNDFSKWKSMWTMLLRRNPDTTVGCIL